MLNDIQAVIIAGGEGKRLGIDMPKCMLDIHGYKLIDICLSNLISIGIKDYVFLLGYKHEVVEAYISDYYSNLNKRISIDAGSGWGKGKAIKYAIVNNSIDKSKRSLIIFPDDLLLKNDIYNEFIEEHISNVNKHGILASVILVSGTVYPYGVAKLSENNLIYEFEEKPFIRLPTNIGFYLFEPQVYDIINDNIDLYDPKSIELESSIMPLLAKKRKLYGFVINSSYWKPINTKKEYEEVLKIKLPL